MANERNCRDCIHYVSRDGDIGCEAWECEYVEVMCRNCRHCIKLYIPPTKEFETVKKVANSGNDPYVCDAFLHESKVVQYLGSDEGICEMYSAKGKRGNEMRECERKISKEVYDRSKKLYGGYVGGEDMLKVFDVSERCGYGVYSPRVIERGGEYFVRYMIGDSCD